MARPKKSEEKNKEPVIAQISVDDFIRTRDSVVTGLSTLQSAVSDLSRAYIAHTNTVLGKGSAPSFDQLNFANPLGGENGLFSARGPTPAPVPEQLVEGKKRKRAPHDKNAPKRALTPFFLYLQSERQTIGNELGDNHTAKEVQDEGGRRWREMAEKEKAKWQEEYGINFARYQEHMKAYKAGQALPEISNAQAKELYEKNKKDKAGKTGKAAHPAASVEAVQGEDHDEAESDESSSEDESPEPPKEPTPPPAKKQKTTKESAKKKAAAAAAKAAEPAVSPMVERTSPEKKKKKGSKKEAAAPPVTSTPKAAEPEQKPKKKGRKHKSGELDA